ncbi:right-handed parallel beta-helix repeat-containing protein [Paenibacillus doosanensis]|nr:right-handed parallel beta-helix repeat-containing protein [Paenibacillus doosanensis]
MKKGLLLLALTLGLQLQTAAAAPESGTVYTLVPEDWGIYADGTHPEETTKGMNDALKWAHDNGKTTFKVPAGTYLIKKQDPKLVSDTSARINMVPDMTFELDDQAVIQKESNGFSGYQTMNIGYGANNVTIKGGTFRGDKDTHDYSSGGTHEGGYGIVTEGAVNVKIDGIKAVNFTGDGLAIGGKGTMIQDLYENSFVPGSFDEQGAPVDDAAAIRTKKPISLNNDIFKTERQFELSNKQKLPNAFDIYFYKEDGTFLKTLKDQTMRQLMDIPDGSGYIHLVFHQADSKAAYVEIWQRAVSKQVVVQNSEFAFNRRQGITVGGGDQITIVNNELHDMKGTAPQSGIDVEGGYGENGHLNTNVFIRNNKFYNNAAYDVILYDGHDATVEGNHMASKGKIGLAVSTPFKNALIKDNHFDATSIYAYHDVQFEGNEMNDSFTHLEGPNLTIDGMKFTDSKFVISSSTPFGITASNITMYNNKGGMDLSLWVNPIHLQGVTVYGGGFSGSAAGSIVDDLKVVGTSALNLPPGTYNRCDIESSTTGVTLDDAGSYVFDQCRLKVKEGVLVTNANADFTMTNSAFEMLDKRYALKVAKASKIRFENNAISYDQMTAATDYAVMIGDYWTRNDPFTVKEAAINGNRIEANMAAEGISTVYAGVGAPKYTIEENTLVNAKLKLRESDMNASNVEESLQK